MNKVARKNVLLWKANIFSPPLVTLKYNNTMLHSEYKFGEVHVLANQIQVLEDHPQFHRIFENDNGGVVLLALKKGQKLNEHLAPAELMVNVIEGSIEFTMIDNPHTINTGEFMLIGEGVPHSVVAKADSKVMFIKIKA